MENVPKKKKRGLPWPALLLAALLLAGMGAYFLRPAPLPPVPETKEKPLLISRSEEEITRLTLQSHEGERVELIRGEQGFFLKNRPQAPLREDLVDSILTAAARVTAEEEVMNAQGVNLADFGLSPALMQVDIVYSDGGSDTLLIGHPTPDETPRRYCMRGGEMMIYSILSAEAEPFFHEADFLRDFAQPDLRGDLLDAIDVTGEVDFRMEYTPGGWQMTRPFRYPLSRTAMDAFLARIESMAFEALLGEEGEMPLAQYGLQPPALTVVLTQGATVITGESQTGESVTVPVAAREYVLFIGAETGKSGVYVAWEHQVFKASNFLLGFWKNAAPQEMLLKSPVNFLVNGLDRFTLDVSGREYSYDVRMVETVTQNNQIATDEYGRILYDAAVRRRGEAEDMDAAAFLSWYQRWAALTPAGTLPGDYAPRGEERCRVTLENGGLTREIAFYPYDALHDAMAVDGVCRYFVSAAKVQSLLTAP